MKALSSIFRAYLFVLMLPALASTGLAQPTLVSTTPSTGTSGVPTNTAVVFQFSERMNQAPPQFGMTWFALVGSVFQTIDDKMTYQWSDDGKSFTARCTGGFPSGVLVAWDMNAVEFTRFIDDFELDQDYSGGFNTAAAGSGGGGSNPATNDIRLSVCFFALYKQNSNAAPVLDPAGAGLFHGDAAVGAGRGNSGVTLTPPGKAAIQLTGVPFGNPTNYILAVVSNSLPLLEASFPSGNYVFTLQYASSNQTFTVGQPAGSAPPAPKVDNFDAAQIVDPAQPFVLQFTAGGVATNFVLLEIEDPIGGTNVFESPGFGAPGALNGVSNQVRIAAGTFQPGRTYDVRLQRFVALSNSIPGAVTLSGYGTITQTKLRTTGGAASHIVRITNATRLGNSFSVIASLGTNTTYYFERSIDFTNWTTVQSLVPTSTNIQVFVDLSPPGGSAFYRFRRE